MPAFPARMPRPALRLPALAAACALLSACSSFDAMSVRMAGVVTPYRVEIVQGNFISKEQVEALKPGMSREQVKQVLGTPLLASVFHAERWDYVFTLRRQGLPAQQRRLTVHFKGDELARFEGDTMPSEAEFVAALDRRRHGTVPPLVATEEQLKRFQADRPAAPPAAPAPPPVTTNYPPLEPAR